MRRIVITERNTKGEITSQEVIKPKQLENAIPVCPENGTKQEIKTKLKDFSDVRYSGKEKCFYVN
jgi:hypothetical protein